MDYEAEGVKPEADHRKLGYKLGKKTVGLNS